MTDRELLEFIRTEVKDCRDTRTKASDRFEDNVMNRLDNLSVNQMDIKQMLEARLQHHESLASRADVALGDRVDSKVSSTMFRWAVGILAAGLIGGSILNYATLRSVQSTLSGFNHELESHVEAVVDRNEAEEKIIRQLIKDAREKHGIPLDPEIYIPKIKPLVPLNKSDRGDN